MVTRSVLASLVVMACGRSDPPTQQAIPVAPVAPPGGLEHVGPNTPEDRPETISTGSDLDEMERETAPYSAQARKSYPDAKRRYLAGLPPGHHLSVVAKLKAPGHVEVVFVAVTGITGDQITGRIANDIRSMPGYKLGDPYTLSESDIVDWVIVRFDGSEEGNVVGNFLDERDAKQPHQNPPAAR